MTIPTTSPPSPLQAVVERLRTAKIDSDPFPHFCLEEVFSAGFYESMLLHLPEQVAYQNLFEITTLKLDHFRYRDQRDLADDWTESLPEDQRRFWDSFNQWFLGPELARAVLQTFSEPMRARFGDEDSWPETSVEVQLIRHQSGFFLQPHSDASSKLVVLLFYLAPDKSGSHLGTSIYRPKNPGFTCPDSAHHPFEDFTKVKTAPYLPNSLLAFERSDRSFHGVSPIGDDELLGGNRDLIQYVLYDRDARQRQLRERGIRANQGAKP